MDTPRSAADTAEVDRPGAAQGDRAADTATLPAEPDAPASGGGLPLAGESGSSIPPEELERLTNDIVAALKTVYDPEIPVDIYELGLIYKVDIDDERTVRVEMTLTAPGCPVAGEMPGWVENAIGSVEGVGHVEVEMVFDPPWDPSRMSDEARVALDFFY